MERILAYSVIDVQQKRIERLERDLRRMLTMNKATHIHELAKASLENQPERERCNWCERLAEPNRFYCARCQEARDRHYEAKARREEWLPAQQGE